MTTGYVTISEFQSSPWYCAFESCCSATGIALTGLIQGYALAATEMIDRYLGMSLWNQPRRDVIYGRNDITKHTRFMPLNSIERIIFQERRSLSDSYYTYSNSNPASGLVTNYQIIDPTTGAYELPNGFSKRYRFFVDYHAGYVEIPEIIKTATMMLMAQLSQQIDTGNLANSDFNYQNVKFDTVSFGFGSSKLIKNLVLKEVNDLNQLPVPIRIMVQNYKYSSSMVS